MDPCTAARILAAVSSQILNPLTIRIVPFSAIPVSVSGVTQVFVCRKPVKLYLNSAVAYIYFSSFGGLGMFHVHLILCGDS